MQWNLFPAAVLAALSAVSSAQTPPHTPLLTATLTVRVDQPGPRINRNIYGHFAEHLGRLIYEGIWVGEHTCSIV